MSKADKKTKGKPAKTEKKSKKFNPVNFLREALAATGDHGHGLVQTLIAGLAGIVKPKAMKDISAPLVKKYKLEKDYFDAYLAFVESDDCTPWYHALYESVRFGKSAELMAQKYGLPHAELSELLAFSPAGATVKFAVEPAKKDIKPDPKVKAAKGKKAAKDEEDEDEDGEEGSEDEEGSEEDEESSEEEAPAKGKKGAKAKPAAKGKKAKDESEDEDEGSEDEDGSEEDGSEDEDESEEEEKPKKGAKAKPAAKGKKGKSSSSSEEEDGSEDEDESEDE